MLHLDQEKEVNKDMEVTQSPLPQNTFFHLQLEKAGREPSESGLPLLLTQLY